MNVLPTQQRPLRRKVSAIPLVLAMFIAAPGSARAQGAGDVALYQVVGGLASPVFATAPRDDSRLFIVEQRGYIRIFKNGQLLPTPFLDVDSISLCCNERGLLGLAFEPDYASTGAFFINYIDNSGNTVIARYLVSGNPDVADAASGEILLTITQPGNNHNGGHIAFGPDGFLYIGMGDGGPSINSQDPTTLLAKFLRIDVSDGYGNPYTVPPTNPFVGPGDPPDEAWSQGLRNPYRWSFDRTTGDLYIADVGAGLREEVNFQPSGSAGGENYGWDIMEGNLCNNNPLPPGCFHPSLTAPIYEYSHTQNRCSITGGYVYRGGSSRIQGRYFFGDFCTGEVWSFVNDPAQGVQNVINHAASFAALGNVTGFGEDGHGELYVVDYGGEVFKIVETPFAYVLDGFGGLSAAGNAAPITPAPPYFGTDAAIDMELAGNGVYVLDRFGGLHAGGGAPAISPAPPFFGFDVAVDLELQGAGGYVLDRFGGIHLAGGVPAFTPPAPYWGFRFARDIEIDNGGVWMLDEAGGIHVGGSAAVFNPAPPYFGFDIARDLEITPHGAYVLDGYGGLHAAGGAVSRFPPTPYFGVDAAADLEVTGTGEIYVLDHFGGIHLGGGAAPATPAPPYFGFDVARDLELR